MKAMLRKILALVIVLAWAAPAAAQNKREMQMMADIRMLQEQTQQLQQQLTTAITQLTDALKAINGRIDDQAGTTRKAFADQKLNVDQVASDLRVVRERVDDTNVRIGSLSQEVEALRLSIPQYPPPPQLSAPLDRHGRHRADAGWHACACAHGSPAAVTGRPWHVAAAHVRQLVGRLHRRPMGVVHSAGSILYLRTFPRSEIADDAQFYIGECHLMDGKFRRRWTRTTARDQRLPAEPVAWRRRCTSAASRSSASVRTIARANRTNRS